jgi:hypothetical protein
MLRSCQLIGETSLAEIENMTVCLRDFRSGQYTHSRCTTGNAFASVRRESLPIALAGIWFQPVFNCVCKPGGGPFFPSVSAIPLTR